MAADNGIWIAVIVAIPPTIAAVVNSRKLDSVHILVNSRLSEALTEIKVLRKVVSSQRQTLDKRSAARKRKR